MTLQSSLDTKGQREPVYLYFVHFAMAYVAMLLGVLLSFALVLVPGITGVTETTIGPLTGEPFWIPEIMVGLVIRWLTYTRLPLFTAFLAWLPPGLFLSYSAVNWQRTMAVNDSTWDTYFGKSCGRERVLLRPAADRTFLHVRGLFCRSISSLLWCKAIYLSTIEEVVWYRV